MVQPYRQHGGEVLDVLQWVLFWTGDQTQAGPPCANRFLTLVEGASPAAAGLVNDAFPLPLLEFQLDCQEILRIQATKSDCPGWSAASIMCSTPCLTGGTMPLRLAKSWKSLNSSLKVEGMAEARRSLSLLLRTPNQNYKGEVLIGHWAAKSTTRLRYIRNALLWWENKHATLKKIVETQYKQGDSSIILWVHTSTSPKI
jgi:hypothetical protein